VTWRSLLVIAVCSGLPGPALALADLPSVNLVVARRVGYVIGDVIPYDVIVTVDRTWVLKSSSLPAPGLPEYWLELRKVAVDESRTASTRVYRIHLVYQSFYAPLEARARELPEFVLEFDHPGGTSDLKVPALTVTMSPLREVATGTGDPEENVALLPDRTASGSSLRLPAIGLASSSMCCLCAGLLLSWQRGAWPFVSRARRPFGRVARTLRGAATVDEQRYAAALRSIHRAFDSWASWRVMADDQARLLAQCPQFAPAAAQIGGFFELSRDWFFGDDASRASHAWPAPALYQFVCRLAALERQA
jgi:mxaA protein